MATSNSPGIDPATLKPYGCPEDDTCTDAGCPHHYASKQEIIPLQDRVLIEPYETDHTSAGGIVLAGDDMKYNRAKVLAVGEGRAMPTGRIPIDVKPGDNVIYGDLQNTIEDKLNGKRVLLIVEQGIVAILKG